MLGWLILRNSRSGRNAENKVEVTLCLKKKIFTFLREISICKGVSLRVLDLPPLSKEKAGFKSA